MDSTLTAISTTHVVTLQQTLAERLRTATSLADASQRFVELIEQSFRGSIALARLYALVPFAALPDGDQRFVENVAGSAVTRISDATRVMSLLGTCGSSPSWNDRARSSGHLGIPLIDASFVEALPMVARMLAELGVDETMFDAPDIHTRRFVGGLNGLFYVADARSTVDRQDRRVIPAQDFVREHGIRTVFGMGGSYLGGEIAVAICFCTEEVSRESAERFALLIHQFKRSTAQLVAFGKLYDEDGSVSAAKSP